MPDIEADVEEEEVEDTADLFAEFSNETTDEAVETDGDLADDDAQIEDTLDDVAAEQTDESDEVPAVDAGSEDPFEEASDEVKEAYAESQKRVNELTHKLRSDDGRVSALHKKINVLEQAAAVPAVSPQQFATAFKDKESWKEFAEDNPDMAKPIEEFMQGLAAATAENLEKTDKRVARLDDAAAVDSDTQAQDDLTEAHPDWLEWISSTDYQQWIAQQPSVVQAIVDDGTVEDSIALLGMYQTYLKASGKLNTAPPDPQVAKIKKKRSRQLQDGAQALSKGGSAKPISDNDTPSLFDFFANKQAS